MQYISIVILVILIVLNIVFKIASIFRLTVPLLYALFISILFPQWVAENEVLVTVIWSALIGLVILSWVVTIRKKIKNRRRQSEAQNMDV